MARLSPAIAASLLLFACAATATSTVPFVSKTKHLPWFYLVDPDASGSSGSSESASSSSSDQHPLVVDAMAPAKMMSQEEYRGAMRSRDIPWVARAQYNASAWDLGWDWLRVEAAPRLVTSSSNPHDRARGYYYAGYAEAFLTQRVIATLAPAGIWGSLPKNVQIWIAEHIDFLKATSMAKYTSDPLWRQVGDLLSQVRGLQDGYNAVTGHAQNTTFEDMFVVSFGAEVGDVMIAVQNWTESGASVPPSLEQLRAAQKDVREFLRKRHPSAFHRLEMGTHCSAMIRPTETDLFMAHDTWSGFSGMSYRIFKRYDMQTTVTLSGYPASIASGDDWYMTSHELAVQETTNEVFNTSLYVAVVPKTISEFIRVMAGNYLAEDGDSWTKIFATLNSGTYNNQYMVVDFKKFTPGKPLVFGTLWIAEQIPGLVVRADVTDVLRLQGYWGSYNTPYFKQIYDLSGYPAMEKSQGSFWSYNKYARAIIFRRNHTDVVDLPSAMRMMRYNDWQNDPFSDIPNCNGTTNGECDPKRSSMLTIASRGDLMTVYNTTAENIAHYGPLYQLVAQGCFGAIDSKVAAWSQRKSLTGYAINGPTSDQQPVFAWNTGACKGTPAAPGAPTVVDFPWVQFDSAY